MRNRLDVVSGTVETFVAGPHRRVLEQSLVRIPDAIHPDYALTANRAYRGRALPNLAGPRMGSKSPFWRRVQE
jgi:hypothetical protein